MIYLEESLEANFQIYLLGNKLTMKGDNFMERKKVKNKYILLSAHREENMDIEMNFLSLMHAVNTMAEIYNMPILYSCHPRSEKYIKSRGVQFDRRVIQHKPLGFFDYNKLLFLQIYLMMLNFY